MQKKIIALAIAGLASTAAFAQSNVTVYGVMDVFAGQVGSAGQTITAVNSGGLQGSRLGFKGVEDLGGGTKALFTIEYAVAADRNDGLGGSSYAATSASSTMARQTFVGLTGDYGTVIGGRLQDLFYTQGANFNPTFGTVVDTLHTAAGNAGTNYSMKNTARLDNAVAYVAPAIGGLTLATAYTANASGTEGAFQDSTQAYQFSGQYAAGAFAAGAVYQRIADHGAIGKQSVGVGASYDFGVAKAFVQGAYDIAAADSGNTSAADSKVTGNQYGVVVPVSSAGAVIASVARVSQATGNNYQSTALVYKHSLSKRTSVYGGVAGTHGDGVGATISAYGGSQAAGDGGNVAAMIVGMNHNF